MFRLILPRFCLPTIAFMLLTLSPLCSAQDASGVWRGSWSADATARRPEHGGPLRVRLIPTGPNSYQGRFSGRFAVIIPYFYRAEVYQQGNYLYSTKSIGRMGQYEMRLQNCCGQMSGRWSAGNQSGNIRLRRR